jgi:hypothetical protein
MSNLNWPEGATHYLSAGDMNTRFRDLSGKEWKYFNAHTGKWAQHYFSSEELLARHDLIARPKPKQWSGPQDGLPPVGTVCRVIKKDGAMAPLDTECEVIAHYRNGHNTLAAFKFGKDYSMHVCSATKDCFGVEETPEQLAAELRETAIREIMDIADVDCRVTAARLVDAGFKREVV